MSQKGFGNDSCLFLVINSAFFQRFLLPGYSENIFQFLAAKLGAPDSCLLFLMEMVLSIVRLDPQVSVACRMSKLMEVPALPELALP